MAAFKHRLRRYKESVKFTIILETDSRKTSALLKDNVNQIEETEEIATLNLAATLSDRIALRSDH